MPLITDRQEIRRRLQQDPVWAAYALGDLSPQCFLYCSWHACRDAFALVFRRYETPILWASGEGPDLARLLEEIGEEPRLDLQVREEALRVLEERYKWESLKTMSRMAVRAPEFQPTALGGAQRLSMESLADVQRLYADGTVEGTSPDYFFPAMLEEGVFFGVFEEAELVAAAGTHVLAIDEGIAAVGNIYTRRDRRGRGYGGAVTSAVVAALLDSGIEIAALNVNIRNVAAARVYERLGFREHCRFREGIAVRSE